VIAADGSMLGVIPREQAMELAKAQELDLVEVAATEKPPVCKIMDYGKFKFEQNKKQRKQKTHQQVLKEIRVTARMEEHDFEVKLKHAREFLAEKDKVMIVCQFKGREMAHMEIGYEKMNRMVAALQDVAKTERAPTRDGAKRVIAILAPR
jgi:translation initiation factor IF-3